jgi:hypothetical protein
MATGESKVWYVGNYTIARVETQNKVFVWSCTCVLFSKIKKCSHIDKVRRSIESPEPVAVLPLAPKPKRAETIVRFGERRFREEE